MRKIITKEIRHKKDRRNQLIVGIFLIGIMIFSVLSFSLTERDTDESEKIEYNGIEFFQEDGYWYFNIEGQGFTTRHNPKEVKDINSFSYFSLQDYTDKPLYFVGNLQDSLELKRNLYPFVLRMQDACLLENCEVDFPVKNCSLDNIIIINETENEDEAGIYQKDNCVFITASLENQTRYIDAFLFKVLEI